MANLNAEEVVKQAMGQWTAITRKEERLNDQLDKLEKEKSPVRENLTAAINEQPLPYPDVFDEWVNRPKRGRPAKAEEATG